MLHTVLDIGATHSCAQLYTYFPDYSPEMTAGQKRPLLLICPGGGYELTSDREAEPVALQWNAMGFHAAVLRYSCAPAVFPTALEELARAVALLRGRAAEFRIDPEKIIVAGFSAGGHLAASLGVFWDKQFLSELTGLTAGQMKPNGLILSGDHIR